MTREDIKILAKFPKLRPELPDAIRSIYDEYYRTNRDGQTKATGAAQKMEAWMHRMVAADLLNSESVNCCLEIGAGTLNHIPYEPNILNYDVIEPFEALYVNSPLFNQVRDFYRDISEISTSTQYDRIVSIAVFEHICDLPQLVANSALLLKPEGQLRVAIPSEGSLLWYAGWRFTTGIEFYLKYKLNYAKLMKFEHVNPWKDIKAVLQIFYESVKSKSFGPAPSLSFYQFYECSQPRKEFAKEFLLKSI